MKDFFTIGIVLGLSAGFAPGPLTALVISETLQHDIRSNPTLHTDQKGSSRYRFLHPFGDVLVATYFMSTCLENLF
jgi:hypothetical protein